MRGNFLTSEFYCTQCGKRGIPVQRKKGSGREAGHLKKLFCLTCQKETNHAECRPGTKYDVSDFFVEFDNNNFSKEGNRIMTYGELKNKLHNKENKNEEN